MKRRGRGQKRGREEWCREEGREVERREEFEYRGSKRNGENRRGQ